MLGYSAKCGVANRNAIYSADRARARGDESSSEDCLERSISRTFTRTIGMDGMRCTPYVIR